MSDSSNEQAPNDPDSRRESVQMDDDVSEGEAGVSTDRLHANIAEASKQARSIFLIYLLFVAYCFLALAGLSDVDLFSEPSMRLPIIGVDIGLLSFFYAGPLLAVGFFVYFNLYLHRLSRLLDELEGVELSRKRKITYPWMITIARQPDEGVIGWLQQLMVHILLWWLLPLLLLTFAYQYGRLYHPAFVIEIVPSPSILLLLSPILGTAIMLGFWWQRRHHDIGTNVMDQAVEPMAIKFELATVLLLVLTVSTLTVWVGWSTDEIAVRGKSEASKLDDSTEWLVVDLSYADLTDENFRKEHLEGADFAQSNLRDSDFRKAYLNRANFNGVHAPNADFSGVYFEDLSVSHNKSVPAMVTDSTGALLRRARFVGANLQNADFKGAVLDSAVLNRANLKGSNLKGAELRGASARRVSFEGAILSGVQADSADLAGAELWNAQLDGADFAGADLSNTFFSKAAYKARFRTQATHLWKSDSTGAYIDAETVFSGADLSGAGLRGVTFDFPRNPHKTFVGKLCSAESLHAAQMPDSTRRAVIDRCPNKYLTAELVEADLFER